MIVTLSKLPYDALFPDKVAQSRRRLQLDFNLDLLVEKVMSGLGVLSAVPYVSKVTVLNGFTHSSIWSFRQLANGLTFDEPEILVFRNEFAKLGKFAKFC